MRAPWRERLKMWVCDHVGHRWTYQIEGPVKACRRCKIVEPDR